MLLFSVYIVSEGIVGSWLCLRLPLEQRHEKRFWHLAQELAKLLPVKLPLYNLSPLNIVYLG